MLQIRKLKLISHSYRDIKRYNHILGVLFRNGFGDLCDRMDLDKKIKDAVNSLTHKKVEPTKQLTPPQRARLVLEELGPTFIKMGQILSTRLDLIPKDFADEFKKLQSHVTAFPYKEAKEIIENELGRKLHDVFETFENKPIGSASLGQAHRAHLKSGEEVVVKVQRPNVQQTIETDLEILLHLATLAENNVEEIQLYQPTKIVEEFSFALERELDYQMEASNITHFTQDFQHDNTIYPFKVYAELSTARVLTMEYVVGISASDLDQIDAAGLDKKTIAQRGVDCVARQIFQNGFFHADPHPGNIIIVKDNRVCFIDLGMVGRLSRKKRQIISELLLAASRKDEAKAVTLLLKLCEYDELSDQSRSLLERQVAELTDKHLNKPLKQLSLAAIFYELIDLLTQHRLHISADFSMMVKAVASLEGLGRSLDPEINLIERIIPIVQVAQMERFDPKNINADLMEFASGALQTVRDLPELMVELLSDIKTGKLKMEIKHQSSDSMQFLLNKVVNRLAFSIVLASLVISSSLMVVSDIPPKWNGIPVIGLVGFVVAAVMSLWLLASILKKGEM